MERYQKFLFYYSFVVSTILLLAALFFVRQPQSFYAFALFLPVPLYFWLKTTTSEKNPYQWSIKMIVTLFSVAALGVWTFWLSGEQNIPEDTKPVSAPKVEVLGTTDADNQETLKLLKDIRLELAELKVLQKLDTRESSPSAESKLLP